MPASIEHLSPQEKHNSQGTQGSMYRFPYEATTMYMMASVQVILPKIIDKQVHAQTASVNYIRSNGTISHHAKLEVFIFSIVKRKKKWAMDVVIHLIAHFVIYA